MAALQTRTLTLGPCLIIFLLNCADSTINTIQSIKKTQGETVVLHCNNSEDGGEGVGWRKNGIVLFNRSPYLNQTPVNFTSSRMQVDPKHPLKLQISNVQPSDTGNYSCFSSKVGWILTVEVTESKPELLKGMFLYIVSSVTGAVAVCIFIFCSVWINRKQKRRNMETKDELGHIRTSFSEATTVIYSPAC